VKMAILTVPSTYAQETADTLVRAGIEAIWNFTNVKLRFPSSDRPERRPVLPGTPCFASCSKSASSKGSSDGGRPENAQASRDAREPPSQAGQAPAQVGEADRHGPIEYTTGTFQKFHSWWSVTETRLREPSMRGPMRRMTPRRTAGFRRCLWPPRRLWHSAGADVPEAAEAATGPGPIREDNPGQQIDYRFGGGVAFRVNLSDYLDTGLFLDHRKTRSLVRQEAAGKRVLNLFCYTASFSVFAAPAAPRKWTPWTFQHIPRLGSRKISP
jgi:hypothetical protein